MKVSLNIALFSFLFIFLSCESDSLTPEGQDKKIDFNATIVETTPLKTRYDSVYINTANYNQNFYLILSTELEDEPITKFGTYRIPSGYEGRLTSIEGEEPLMWQSLNTNHVFYGWTIPWNESFYQNSVDTDYVDSFEVEFYDSSESNFNDIHNNNIYETFVGAKSLPYSYNEHGKYVDLTFFHLVSKIKIGTFQLTEASGAIQRNLKAEVTFINIPKKGTFYPFPDNGKKPYIEPASPSENEGLTYYISNNPREDQSDIFYISPETDFSSVNFQIKLKDIKYAYYDTYYGTFDAVEFIRNTPVEDFDSPEGNDNKILHAGEMMTININLIPGKGPGLKLVIDKWNTEQPTKSQYHTYRGIYTDAELNQLLESFRAQTGPEDLEAIERLFESYGVTKDGKKYFPLYENADVSRNSYGGNYFPVWKDYILDGQGHTLTMKTNSFGHWFGGAPYFNIGPARDIYVTDPSGKYSMYIDSDGFVWTYDIKTNTYNKTENQLGDLEGKYQGNNPANSYNINPVTGQVEYASYYNGRFGE